MLRDSLCTTCVYALISRGRIAQIQQCVTEVIP